MSLAEDIKQIQSKQDKKILLMTHIVLGYPSFEVNRGVVRQMVENGVDLIEMQIPFSEPMADGPVIVKANQDALENGTTVAQCLEFAAEITETYDIPFLFMTYYNILFKYGEEDFFKKAKKINIKGLIVPDMPPEEGETYFSRARKYELAPIMIFAPTSTNARMKNLAGYGDGFIYCVARKGVTGTQTSFDDEFNNYIGRCRQATDLPLAVGFGISAREDVDYLIGKADIAVIGTKTIKLVEKKGVDSVGLFIKGLRR